MVQWIIGAHGPNGKGTAPKDTEMILFVIRRVKWSYYVIVKPSLVRNLLSTCQKTEIRPLSPTMFLGEYSRLGVADLDLLEESEDF